MTRKQIENLRRSLGDPFRKNMTEEQIQLDKEISCREMINSILIYEYRPGQTTYISFNNGVKKETPIEQRIIDDRYMKKYSEGDSYFAIGRDRVLELIKEQLADFSKAIVGHNVYTDFEGCSYNTCKWADEQ